MSLSKNHKIFEFLLTHSLGIIEFNVSIPLETDG